VVSIPYTSIDKVFEVRQLLDVSVRAGQRRTHAAFVALQLKHSADAFALRCAVHAEMLRVHSHPLFTRGTATWDDVPVHVRPNGDIWIRRDMMFLLRALERYVRRGASAAGRAEYGAALSTATPAYTGQALRDVMYYGQWSRAQQLAQFRLGLSYDASVRHLASLLEPDGSRTGTSLAN
jgi:hypothetical protein